MGIVHTLQLLRLNRLDFVFVHWSIDRSNLHYLECTEISNIIWQSHKLSERLEKLENLRQPTPHETTVISIWLAYWMGQKESTDNNATVKCQNSQNKRHHSSVWLYNSCQINLSVDDTLILSHHKSPNDKGLLICLLSHDHVAIVHSFIGQLFACSSDCYYLIWNLSKKRVVYSKLETTQYSQISIYMRIFVNEFVLFFCILTPVISTDVRLILLLAWE